MVVKVEERILGREGVLAKAGGTGRSSGRPGPHANKSE